MEQNHIHVFAKWQVKEDQLDTVLNLLIGVAKQSAAEAGNLYYNVHQSEADANTLLLAEGYTDEAAVALHRESAYFQTIVIGKIVPLLETREVTLTKRLF